MLSLVPRRGAHPLALALAVALALGLALPVTAAHADTTLLNVSYDPTRELYQEFNAAFAEHWKAQDRRDGHHQAVARRLGQAGARGDRRPRGRRRDAGARLRHRRASPTNGKLLPADWQKRLPQQLRALHLDDRVPGPQGQPEGHQGLGRSGQAGRRGRSRRTRRPRAARAGTTSRPGATR